LANITLWNPLATDCGEDILNHAEKIAVAEGGRKERGAQKLLL
jgi:hypothetical protein